MHNLHTVILSFAQHSTVHAHTWFDARQHMVSGKWMLQYRVSR